MNHCSCSDNYFLYTYIINKYRLLTTITTQTLILKSGFLLEPIYMFLGTQTHTQHKTWYSLWCWAQSGLWNIHPLNSKYNFIWYKAFMNLLWMTKGVSLQNKYYGTLHEVSINRLLTFCWFMKVSSWSTGYCSVWQVFKWLIDQYSLRLSVSEPSWFGVV
jgi:hypothetical protein